MFRLSTFVATLALVLNVAAQASANGWIICNRTPEKLDVAIAYHDGPNGWLTEGWWQLNACGGCKTVMEHSKTDGTNVFLHATTTKGVPRIVGEGRFCVSDHAKGAPAWTGRSGKKCGPGYVSASFQKHVVDTDKNFTTNIRGKVGGRTCVD